MRTPSFAAPLALAAILLLAGCTADADPNPSASASETPSTAPEPTETTAPTEPVSTLPDGVLFRISATVEAPNGAVATLVESVRTIAATTDSATEGLLDEQCDPSWRGYFTDLAFITGEITAEVVSGAWDAAFDAIAVDLANYSVWTGSTQPFQAYCATALIDVPGTAVGVSPLNGEGAESDGGWAVYRYGFGNVGTAAEEPGPENVVFTDCAIELSPEAEQSGIAASWPDNPEIYNGLGCYFGGF